MQEDGIVSLWIGEAPSLSALERYLEVRYSPDGEWIAPPFADDFSLSRYEDANREAEVFAEPINSFSELLKGFSYDGALLPQVIDRFGDDINPPATATVLIYHYRHTGPSSPRSKKDVSLRFVGAVSIRETE